LENFYNCKIPRFLTAFKSSDFLSIHKDPFLQHKNMQHSWFLKFSIAWKHLLFPVNVRNLTKKTIRKALFSKLEEFLYFIQLSNTRRGSANA